MCQPGHKCLSEHRKLLSNVVRRQNTQRLNLKIPEYMIRDTSMQMCNRVHCPSASCHSTRKLQAVCTCIHLDCARRRRSPRLTWSLLLCQGPPTLSRVILCQAGGITACAEVQFCLKLESQDAAAPYGAHHQSRITILAHGSHSPPALAQLP